MKRTVIIFCLLATAYSGLQAQTKDSIDVSQFVAVYDFVTNTKDKDGGAATDSVQLAVVVGTHAAKCMEFNRTMMEDFGEGRNRDYQYGEWNARKYNLPVLFVNEPEGEVSAFDKIAPNRFFVSEPLPDFGWTLASDTMTICGYPCLKAVGKYGGRTWTAWYSEELAVSFGPWKLCGLPGMILRADDGDGVFSFRLVGLMQKQATMKYFSKNGYKDVPRNKFIKQRNKVFCVKQYVQNPHYYIPEGVYSQLHIIEMWPGGPEPPANEKLSVVATDMIIPKAVNVYQPLELK